MQARRKFVGLLGAIALSFASVQAGATGLIAQGSSGHPYQSTAWSNYTISDATVTFTNRGWAVPLPLDASAAHWYYVFADTVGGQAATTAWVFDEGGNVVGGYGVSGAGSGSASSIYVNGFSTMFIRTTTGSAVAGVYSAGYWY
jgi:hypothetical protein